MWELSNTVPIWKKYSLSIQEAAEYTVSERNVSARLPQRIPMLILFWKWDCISGLKENSSKNIWMNLQRCRFCQGK